MAVDCIENTEILQKIIKAISVFAVETGGIELVLFLQMQLNFCNKHYFTYFSNEYSKLIFGKNDILQLYKDFYVLKFNSSNSILGRHI